jgi:hypothetical protein
MQLNLNLQNLNKRACSWIGTGPPNPSSKPLNPKDFLMATLRTFVSSGVSFLLIKKAQDPERNQDIKGHIANDVIDEETKDQLPAVTTEESLNSLRL